MKPFDSFTAAIDYTSELMRTTSHIVHTEKWQGFDISQRPEARMREIINHSFRVQMLSDSLDVYRDQIKPNLPWADSHFEERVCGQPLNPGETWKQWPFSLKAQESLRNGQFDVNYMERYWPRYAGLTLGGKPPYPIEGNRGIRFRYGDLNDLIDLLAREPLTRQAYLPIFFPEDTGAHHGLRVPCTLGYHFLMRDNYLHVFYPIRSCDFYRHFRDDIYLTIRLTLWIRDQVRSRNPRDWKKVRLGWYSMWIGSLHLFVNDYARLFGK